MNTIIIGAGIAGLAAAWQLLEQGVEHVIVLEREPLPFSHSSARNAAIFRPLEEHLAVVKMVSRSEQLLAELTGATQAIRACGLLLVSKRREALDHQAHVAQQCDVACARLGTTQLYEKYPELEGGRARHALWLPHGGVLDIHRVAEALRARVGALGGTLKLNADIRALRTHNARISGVELTGGSSLDAEQVVIAAGAWAATLGQSCSAPLPLVPHRRHLAFLMPTSASCVVPPSRPVVWDVETGVYFRPESGGILACPGDHEISEPCVPPVEPGQLERLALHLPRLCPLLDTYGVQRPWACLRTISADTDMVVGADPRVKGLFWIAGLGGQGMSAGLGAGELLAEAVTDKPEQSHAKHLSPKRFCTDLGPARVVSNGRDSLNG